VVASFQKLGWSAAIGSSGTIKTAESIAGALGLGDHGVTKPALEQIIEAMIAARRVDALDLPSLGSDRAPVFPGGIAILVEVLSHFGIDRMQVSEGALREGLLYDMLGRLQHEDVRERSIRAMQLKFHVDEEQAQRVESTAALLLKAVAKDWELGEEAYLQLLCWAARLHEIGLDIAHSKYQLHGSYLLAHADMPGFARVEQRILATLVGHHRRKLDSLSMEALPEEWRGPLFKLIVLLRLAVLLNRARGPAELPPLVLIGALNRLEVRFPKDWYNANPLTHADLCQEQAFLKTRGFELVLGSGANKLKKIRRAD
jgi:exopolyphosphatase/guanosine-5'-triphosphate,3'-diphosphate pyrophosphatase